MRYELHRKVYQGGGTLSRCPLCRAASSLPPPNRLFCANFESRFNLMRCGHVARKPLNRPFNHIPAMHRVAKSMALVRVDNQLCCHMPRPKRMPELVGLRSRALSVAIAHHQ